MSRISGLSFSLFRTSGLTVCLLSGTVLALAQTQGGATGSTRSASATTHTVRGKIFLPSGSLPEQRLRVVLELNTGGIAGETFSDSVGNFEFRAIPGNSYRVVVPGDGRLYETVQETVDVYGNFSRTFTIQIYLREKSAESVVRPKSRMISAAELSQNVPRDAAKLYEKGAKKAKDGKADEAVVLLQDSLKIFPEYLLALNKLGEQFLALKRPEEARTAFEKALAVNSKYPLPHINLGLLFYQQKHYAEAIEHLETASRLDESFSAAHLYLGLSLMDNQPGDFERAERELLRAHALGGPEMVKVRQYLFNLHVRRQNWQKAAEQLEAYLQEAPDGPDAAAVREKLGQLKKLIARKSDPPQKP